MKETRDYCELLLGNIAEFRLALGPRAELDVLERRTRSLLELARRPNILADLVFQMLVADATALSRRLLAELKDRAARLSMSVATGDGSAMCS